MASDKESRKPKLPGAKAQPVLRHVDDAVASTIIREQYTRERHYFLMRLIMGMMLCLIVSGSLNIYQASRPVIIKLIATDRDGRISPVTAVDEPIGNDAERGVWLTNALAQAYTFDFANYRQQETVARLNFTPAGWSGFEKAISNDVNGSGLLQTVLEGRMVTTAVPAGAPVEVNKGHIEGRYAWMYQVPFVISFQGPQGSRSQTLLMHVVVVRQPETEQPRGLGIAQIIAE